MCLSVYLCGPLTLAQRVAYERDGFLIVHRLFEAQQLAPLHTHYIQICPDLRSHGYPAEGELADPSGEPVRSFPPLCSIRLFVARRTDHAGCLSLVYVYCMYARQTELLVRPTPQCSGSDP